MFPVNRKWFPYLLSIKHFASGSPDQLLSASDGNMSIYVAVLGILRGSVLLVADLGSVCGELTCLIQQFLLSCQSK